MKLDSKSALGIGISNGRISLALLKKDNKDVKLLKAATGPVPDGAIKNGSIEDAALLAKGISQLRSRSKIWIRFRQAAVSLVTKPMLVQIMNVPNQVPTNVVQFVHNEIKHCVALSGKEVALDFCRTGAGGQAGSRMLVVATDSRKVTELVKACNIARVNVEALEPSVAACIRALYAKKIAKNFDSNVLIATLEGCGLTLSVFRKRAMDFVRTRDLKETAQPSEVCQWLAEEITAIIQFYDMAADSDSPRNWEITVVADSAQLPKDAEQSLKIKVACDNLQVRTFEDACQDTSVVEDGAAIKTGASIVAIGLALKLLRTDENDLRINLLPQEAAEVKAVKKNALITANIIAAVLFLTVLAGGVLSAMIKKVNESIVHKKQGRSSQDTSALIKEERLIDRQMKQLSDGPGRVDEILASRGDVDWAALLNELRSVAPKTVRITNLFSRDNSKISLEGLALSYEAVHLFVNMLAKSELTEDASLIGTEKDNDETGYVRYQINCSIIPRRGT